MNNFIMIYNYVFHSSPWITTLLYVLLYFLILFIGVFFVWVFRSIMKLLGKDATYNHKLYSKRILKEISPCTSGNDNKILYRPITFMRDKIAGIITKGLVALVILAYTTLLMMGLQYISDANNNSVVINVVISMFGGILISIITILFFLWLYYEIKVFISKHRNEGRAKIRIRKIIGRRKHD